MIKKALSARGKSFFRPRWLIVYAILIGLLSLFGAWILFYTTALSPWGGSDSVEYLVSARNMLRGIGIGYYSANGTFYWISLHPPFYSMVLGVVSLLGLDLVDAARWLNIFLFALTIGITGILFWRYSNSPSFSVLAGLLILAFPAMLQMFTGAMSEPLFIFLCILQGLLLILYFRAGRTRYLLLSALAAGLASLTRYVGAAFIGAGAVSLFLFCREKWPGRFWKSALYFVLACLPLFFWLGGIYFKTNHTVAGRATSLDLSGLLDRLQPFRLAVVGRLWGWLPLQNKLAGVPYRGQLAFLALVVLVVVVLTVIAYWQLARKVAPKEASGDLYLVGIFGLFSLAYIAFLAATTAFTSPPPEINDRVLLPLYLSVVIALLAAFSLWGKRWLAGPWGWLKIIPWVLAALCLFQFTPKSTAFISRQHANQGLRVWENTAIVEAVRGLPKDIPVISTRPNVLLLWADRPAYLLTVDFSPEFLSQTGPYGSDPQDPLQKIFREDGAALVDFNDLSPLFIKKYGNGLSSTTRLDQLIEGLVIYQQTPNWAIYFYPK